MKPERVGAVVNPHAGDGDAAKLFAELADRFPDATVEADITTGPADVPVATRRRAEWADLLVVIGGDGTLREAVEALVEVDADTALFVVPAGRGNSSYRHLYGRTDWRRLADGIASGLQRRPLEVGRIDSEPDIEETYFLLGFTAGLFRNAVVNAERFRALPGPLAYVLATAQAALLDDAVEAAVEVDEEPFFDGAARLIAVGGGRYRGSDFELFPDSRPGDGLLHALAVEPAGLGGAVGLTRRAREGRLHEHPAVSYAKGETVTLRSRSGLPVEVDGTPISRSLSESRIAVVSDAISVAYPD